MTELLEYWLSYPPPHISAKRIVEAFTTWTPYKARGKELDEKEVSGLMEMVGSGLESSSLSQAPAYVKELTDWAEEMKQKIGR